MQLIKTYKYKLRLRGEQALRVDRWIGTCRFVYNLALETRQEARKSGANLTAFDLMKQLTALRDGYDWIGDVPVHTQQNVIERLDSAYKKFFSGGGFPKWAKKGEYSSLVFKSVKKSEKGFILPKLGEVRIFKDREPVGVLRTATITKEIDGYYLCVTAQTEAKETVTISEKQAVGIDMGITYFLSDSTGAFVGNPRHTLEYQNRLRIENRSLARKKKGSASWRKQKERVGKLHRKIGRTRRDFLHKQSTAYVAKHDLICAEDLQVKNMVKNGSLSKHISDASWSEFFGQLRYKAAFEGKHFVQVPPQFTSQTCNKCGHCDRANRQTQSKFECLKCGHASNADTNAAKNIKTEGIGLVRQRGAVARALNQEPHAL